MSTRPAFAILLILAGGCGDEVSLTFPDRDPVIVGRIVARDVPSSISRGSLTFQVKKSPEEECGIIFTGGPETQVARKTSGGYVHNVRIDHLARGSIVAVWTTLILESCPAQARAEAVAILGP